jgi:hypothetical protein
MLPQNYITLINVVYTIWHSVQRHTSKEGGKGESFLVADEE